MSESQPGAHVRWNPPHGLHGDNIIKISQSIIQIVVINFVELPQCQAWAENDITQYHLVNSKRFSLLRYKQWHALERKYLLFCDEGSMSCFGFLYNTEIILFRPCTYAFTAERIAISSWAI